MLGDRLWVKQLRLHIRGCEVLLSDSMKLDSTAGSIAKRIDGLEWPRIRQQLEDDGFVAFPPLLTAAECAALSVMYEVRERFRSRIDMARFRFGLGEYKYFADPLPSIVAELREWLYP